MLGKRSSSPEPVANHSLYVACPIRFYPGEEVQRVWSTEVFSAPVVRAPKDQMAHSLRVPDGVRDRGGP